jgi:hypothetical protein
MSTGIRAELAAIRAKAERVEPSGDKGMDLIQRLVWKKAKAAGQRRRHGLDFAKTLGPKKDGTADDS